MRDFVIRLREDKAGNYFMQGWIFAIYDRPRDPEQDRNMEGTGRQMNTPPLDEAKAAWLDGYDMAMETLEMAGPRGDLVLKAFVKETVLEWED